MTKREILEELQKLAIECGNSGYFKLGACLAFIGCAASMSRESEAANALEPISQRIADDANKEIREVN